MHLSYIVQMIPKNKKLCVCNQIHPVRIRGHSGFYYCPKLRKTVKYNIRQYLEYCQISKTNLFRSFDFRIFDAPFNSL